MTGETVFLIVLGFVVLALAFRLAAGAWDADRIEQHIVKQGGQLLKKEWSPMGKGWFGDNTNRIYEILYRDASGRTHQATCKTSALAGVYFTEDNIMEQSQAQELPTRTAAVDNDQMQALREENRRLREELERANKQNTE